MTEKNAKKIVKNYLNDFAALRMGFTLIKISKNTEAPHKHKGMSQLYKDVVLFMQIGLFALLTILPMQASSEEKASAAISETKVKLLPSHIRKIVLDKHLKHLVPYEQCIIDTVKQSQFPEMLLLSILYQEYGRNGKYSTNSNSSKDYGLSQINDARKEELARIGLTLNDVLNDGCKSIIGMTYLLRGEYDKANGDLWTAVGNYHYSKAGKYPHNHYKYIQRVHEKWSRMFDTIRHSVTNN